MLRADDVSPPILADGNGHVAWRNVGNRLLVGSDVSFLLPLFHHLTDPYDASDLIVLPHLSSDRFASLENVTKEERKKKKVKEKTFLGVAFSSFCDSFGKQRNVEGERVIFKGQLGFLKWSLIFV